MPPRYPVQGPITQRVGPGVGGLDSPGTYRGQYYPSLNKGYDFGVPIGTPVNSPIDGTVIAAGWQDSSNPNAGWGLRIWVRDRNGIIHNFGHLGRIDVKVGDTIKSGQTLALSGNTGASTGPHLSYDVFREGPGGGMGEILDPDEYLSQVETGGGNVVNAAPSATTLNATQTRNASLIATKAYQYAMRNGADPRMAERFARSAVAIAYSESGLGNTLVGDNGESHGLFHTHVRGRNLTGIGQQAQTAQQLASVLSNPDVDIDNSLPELFAGFQQVQSAGIGFDQNPIQFITQLSRVAQKPDERALTSPGVQQAFTIGLGLPVSLTMPGPQGQYDPNNPGGQARQLPGVTGIVSAANPRAATNTISDVTPQALVNEIQKALAAEMTKPNPNPEKIANITSALRDAQSVLQAVSPSPNQLSQNANQVVLQTMQGENQLAQIAARVTGDASLAGMNNDAAMARLRAELSSRAGITDATLRSEETRVIQEIASRERIAAQSDATARWQTTQNREVSEAELRERARQFDLTYGNDVRRLGLEETIGMGQLAISQGRLSLDERLGMGRLDLDREIARDANAISRERMGLDQRIAERQDVVQTVSALVDLLSAQIAAGALTESAADRAVKAALDVYDRQPTNRTYQAGREPGGLYGQMMQNFFGTTPDYSQYKLKQLPFDPSVLERAQNMTLTPGFDMSQGWQKALEMIQGVRGGMGAPLPGGSVGQMGQAQLAQPTSSPPLIPSTTPGQAPPLVPQAAQMPAGGQGGPVQAPSPASAGPPGPITKCPDGYEPQWNQAKGDFECVLVGVRQEVGANA